MTDIAITCAVAAAWIWLFQSLYLHGIIVFPLAATLIVGPIALYVLALFSSPVPDEPLSSRTRSRTKQTSKTTDNE